MHTRHAYPGPWVASLATTRGERHPLLVRHAEALWPCGLHVLPLWPVVAGVASSSRRTWEAALAALAPSALPASLALLLPGATSLLGAMPVPPVRSTSGAHLPVLHAVAVTVAMRALLLTVCDIAIRPVVPQPLLLPLTLRPTVAEALGLWVAPAVEAMLLLLLLPLHGAVRVPLHTLQRRSRVFEGLGRARVEPRMYTTGACSRVQHEGGISGESTPRESKRGGSNIPDMM